MLLRGFLDWIAELPAMRAGWFGVTHIPTGTHFPGHRWLSSAAAMKAVLRLGRHHRFFAGLRLRKDGQAAFRRVTGVLARRLWNHAASRVAP
ncbi:MAG: hypothetical protein KDI42_11235 [Gammaproteobacteria bacterium]|nr:hypothetical protein [Gammaproteobacteria bacterium]